MCSWVAATIVKSSIKVMGMMAADATQRAPYINDIIKKKHLIKIKLLLLNQTSKK